MHPDQPSAFGPFQLYEILGRGGAGEVWRARVPGQPLDIAVKQLRDDRWGPGAIERFLDEARATAALDHPHLVQVLDFGTVREGGVEVPYLAMDLASGGTLASNGPELDWTGLSRAILQVLDALACAHAAGTTHLDIKADNVLLGLPRDGRTGWRVVDFGIAYAAGGGASEGVSGTPTHMAPEQWRGEWRDFGPWTDLYAVGCMVWHLATGMPAYRGDLMELARLHQTGALPPFVPTRPVPPGLAGWLARAMHPDLGARFQHAADAADAWLALGEAEAGTGAPAVSEPLTDDSETYDYAELPVGPDSAPTVPVAAPQPERCRPVPGSWRAVDRPGPPLTMGVLGLGMVASRVPPLVGRTALRDRLWQGLSTAAQTGEPVAICLYGAPGCGKTRLATWLGRTAAQGNHGRWLVARHSGVEDAGVSLATACARFLRCEGLSAHEVATRVGRFARSVGADDPEDAELLVELVRSEAPPTPSALVRALDLLSRAGPLVLVLDNADRAPGILGLVGRLSGPVVVVATWEGEPELEAPWVVEAVEPLPSQQMRLLVEGMLPLTASTVERLVQGAAGNPEEAVQRIVHHTRQGDFHPVGDRYQLDPEASEPADSLDALWQDRIDAALADMDADQRFALYVAAALGVRVRDGEWLAALDGQVPPGLAPLLEAHVAERSRGDAGWRFAHPRVRSAMEREARAAGRWVEAHARCAAALLALGADRGRIGVHLLESGELDPAVTHLLVAAEAAFSSGRAHAASAFLAHLDRAFAALDRPETDAEHVEALVVTARVARQRFGPTASIAGAERALELARENGDADLVAKAGRGLAMAIRSARRAEEAVALLEGLLDDPGPRIGVAERSRLLAALGVSLCDLASAADPDLTRRARAALDEAVSLGGLSAAQGGDALLYTARLIDDPTESEGLLRQALAAYREAGTRIGQAISHHDLALVALNRDDPALALEHYTESARLFALSGAHAADTARMGMGLCLVRLERFDEAVGLFEGVVDRGRRRGRNYLQLMGLIGLLGCAVATGRWEHTDLLLDQAEAVADGVQFTAKELGAHLERPMRLAEEAGRESVAARLEALGVRALQPPGDATAG